MKRWWAPAVLCVAGYALRVAAGGAGPEPRRPHFTDIAPKSNFAYRTDNNFTGRKYFPQTMCGGVAAFDFDNDGRMDLFFTNGAKLPELEKTDARFYNCLLRNRGDGTFEDVTARAGLLGKDLGIQLRRGRRRLRQRRLRRSVRLQRGTAIRCTTTTATAPSPTSPRAPASGRSPRMF